MKNFQNFGGGITYLSPEIDICEIPINRGFAGSTESFEDGESLMWDSEE